MNYFFIGGKDIGNYILEQLIENYDFPKFVIAFRKIIDEKIIKELEEKKVHIIRIRDLKTNIKEIIDSIDFYHTEIMISVAFPQIIPNEILKKIKYPLNVHTALLPKYRGFHPISAAFLNDEEYQGTTIHFMTEELDSGDILMQDSVKVTNTDDIVTIKEKLIKLSSTLLLKVLDQIQTQTHYPRKQKGEVIYAPKRKPEDSKIDFTNKSRFLHNFVRSLVSPYPNAFAYRKRDKKKVLIKKSVAADLQGVVIDKTVNGRYVVSTTDGVLLLETDVELQIGDVLE